MDTSTFPVLFILVLILVGIALIGLAISILIKKNGRFPETHIGRNKNLKDKGINCAQSTDRNDRRDYEAIDIDHLTDEDDEKK